MATVLTNKRPGVPGEGYDRTVMPGVGDGQKPAYITGTYTFTAAVPSGTVIQGPMIQSGSTIIDTLVIVTGGGSATFNVGTGDDPDYFAAAAAGPVVRSSAATAAPLYLTKNDTLDVTTGGAVTGAAGSITIVAIVMPRNN